MESSASSTHKKLKEISTKRKNIYTIFDACQNVVDLVGREFRFIGHMAAFLFKPNRALLPGMTNGTVDAKYAAHRHSLWKPEKDR